MPLSTQKPQVLVLMGVSGCGKTTVAAILAGRLSWPFEEGDALTEQVRVRERHAGDVAEHADVLGADMQAAQHLNAAEQHRVVDLADHAAGFGDIDEFTGGEHALIVIAQAGDGLVEAHLALGQ